MTKQRMLLARADTVQQSIARTIQQVQHMDAKLLCSVGGKNPIVYTNSYMHREEQVLDQLQDALMAQKEKMNE